MTKLIFGRLRVPHPHPLPWGERGRVRGTRSFVFALHALSAVLVLFLLPSVTAGQGIFQGFSGLLEFDYTFFSSKTTDASGTTTKFRTNTYDPRATLSVNTDIFPKLNLNAGAVFEKNISIFSSEGESTKTTLTRWRPYIYLTLRDPLYEVGIGYNRKEDTTKVTETPHFTLINDDYLATLKWRPEGFPSIETQLERTNTYDESRDVQNTTKDYVSLLSRYTFKGLDIRYQGTYTDTDDKVGQIETKDMLHSAWVSYSDAFFDRRVSVSSTYNFNYEEIKTSTSASGVGGTVSLQLFPLAGLSINNNITTPLTLNANPALIDGNFTASAGINLGLPPLGGDTTARNMGLDFFLPTEVNQLLLWIDRDLSTAPAIVTFFSSNIQVFSSPDNLNWTPVPLALPPITFGPFQNRFVINFTNVTTRFIKVVTPPLNAAILGASSFPNIFVTELQAFLTQPVGGTPGKKSLTTTRMTHNYYLDARARILDIPTLFYELDYFYTRIDPGGQLRYTVSNGLSGNYRFSPIFSGRARVAYENGEEEKEHRSAWIYDAALEATPLRTLTDRLVFSGRDETIGGRRNSNNSVILYNIAELYKGLDVNLNIGQNFSRDESGLKTNETDFQMLATIIPHPTLNLTLDYKYSIINRSGGTNPGGSGNMQTGEFIVSYRPFRTLFVVATIDLSTTTDGKTLVTQNYGFNWSPFPDGALQFRFFYNENLATGNVKERIINPGVRWNITKRSYLDLSYQKNINTSPSQKVDENIISLQAKIFL
jgi:hypothetical protein